MFGQSPASGSTAALDIPDEVKEIVITKEPSALNCIPNMIGDLGTALGEASAAVMPAPEPPKPTGVMGIAGGYFNKIADKIPAGVPAIPESIKKIPGAVPAIPESMKKMPALPNIPEVKTHMQPRSGKVEESTEYESSEEAPPPPKKKGFFSKFSSKKEEKEEPKKNSKKTKAKAKAKAKAKDTKKSKKANIGERGVCSNICSMFCMCCAFCCKSCSNVA